MFHNKLDNAERLQAQAYLDDMHLLADSQIESAAKHALLQVDGDQMLPSQDSLTSADILSAGPGATLNPSYAPPAAGSARASSSTTGPPNPERLEKLIRALRSRCQSLADGGQRFYEVFDMLDKGDTGEIEGLTQIGQVSPQPRHPCHPSKLI